MNKNISILFFILSITVYSQVYQPNQWCSKFPVMPRTGTLWCHASVDIPTPVTGNVAECYNDSLIYCMLWCWNTYETIC